VSLNTRPVLASVQYLLLLLYSLPKCIRARIAELVWAVQSEEIQLFYFWLVQGIFLFLADSMPAVGLI
jgi:hypothetical protein